MGLLRRYAVQRSEPVNPSFDELDRMGLRYVTGDILQREEAIRHDRLRLTQLLIKEFMSDRAAR
jgi:hypothetical protein